MFKGEERNTPPPPIFTFSFAQLAFQKLLGRFVKQIKQTDNNLLILFEIYLIEDSINAIRSMFYLINFINFSK